MNNGIRLPFNSIFLTEEDGSLRTIQDVRMNWVSYAGGIHIPKGQTFGGVDWQLFYGRDLLVKTDGGTAVILGLFK